MKKLTSKSLKKMLIGILISDGYLQKTPNSSRLDMYTIKPSYAEYIKEAMSSIPKLNITIAKKISRYNTVGYRLWTTTHRYLDKLYPHFYRDGVKILSTYILRRIDAEALAHIWMCDGYLERRKNKTRQTIQHLGTFCLESFTRDELIEFSRMLKLKFNLESKVVEVTGKKAKGKYRVIVTGIDLQKMIDIMYPFILPTFKYKTWLFYKTDKYISNSLINTEQIIHTYETLNDVEDIIRAKGNL